MGWTSKPGIEKNNNLIREWMSTKLVEYESLWVSNGWVRVGSSSSKMSQCELNMPINSTKYQYFQQKVIIERVGFDLQLKNGHVPVE